MIDVKNLREKLGLSKQELAEKLDVSTRSIELWEQGRNEPSGPAKKLLEILDGGGEIISSKAKDNSVAVSAGKGSNVNVGTETERLISMLVSQQELMSRHLDSLAKRDEQIDRLISLLERK